jgi:hypothetical protein
LKIYKILRRDMKMSSGKKSSSSSKGTAGKKGSGSKKTKKLSKKVKKLLKEHADMTESLAQDWKELQAFPKWKLMKLTLIEKELTKAGYDTSKLEKKKVSQKPTWKEWVEKKWGDGYGWVAIANMIRDVHPDVEEHEFINFMSKLSSKPSVHEWKQTSGDANPKEYYCYLTKVTENEVEVAHIESLEEVGQDGWRLKSATYSIEDLSEYDEDVASFVDLEPEDKWKKASFEQRAESKIDYYGGDSSPIDFDTFEEAVEYITDMDISEVEFWTTLDIQQPVTVGNKTYTGKQVMQRKRALVEALDLDKDEIEDINVSDDIYYGMIVLKIGNKQYAVGTDEEADKASYQREESYIETQGVQYINGWDNYIDEEKAEGVFRGIYDLWNNNYASDIMHESHYDPSFINRLAGEMHERGVITREQATNPDFDLNDKIDEFVDQLTNQQIREGRGGYDYYESHFGKEQANKLVLENNLVDVDALIEYVISADGRGFILGSYDGDELEEQIDGKYYYIYRIN